MNEKNKISNFKSGNNLEIEKIINEYSNYVFVVIKNICGSYMQEEDIEEIILDVFVAIWKNREKLDEDKDIKPYLASIAHNLTKKKLEQRKLQINNVKLDENSNDLEEVLTDFVENKLKMDELNAILKTLSAEEYQIFTKFYYDAKKVKEIASSLDISVVKVKTKLHRIRNKIKRNLKERGYSK